MANSIWKSISISIRVRFNYAGICDPTHYPTAHHEHQYHYFPYVPAQQCGSQPNAHHHHSQHRDVLLVGGQGKVEGNDGDVIRGA